MNATGLSGKAEKLKANVLLHIIGPEAVDIFNGFTWQEGESQDKSSDILDKFGAF